MVGEQRLIRIALLGGSFDPPHRGHAALAQAALEQLPIDELWWLPAGQPWQKARTLTDSLHRVAMVRLMVAASQDPRQRIETCEIDRGGATYTIDTLEELSRHHPAVRWTLVIGQDQLRGLSSWRRWPEVVERADLAVAMRPSPGSTALSELQAPPGARITPLSMLPDAVSSTELRQALSMDPPMQPQGLMPEVARYIAEHGLYRPTG